MVQMHATADPSMQSIYPVIRVKVNHKRFGLKKKDIAAASEFAYAETLRYWHVHMHPEHYKVGAVEKYGYKKRTKKHMKRKARKKGHQMPLVWSGDLRTRASMVRDIRTNTKGGKLVMRDLPKHTYQYHLSAPIHKEQEIVATTEEEIDKLKEVFLDAFIKKLNSMTAIADVTVGTADVVDISKEN